MTVEPLTKRWYDLRYVKPAVDYFKSANRFNVAWAGRRSGKTEKAKRRLWGKAKTFFKHPDGRFIMAAPTLRQAKDIFWKDTIAAFPVDMLYGGSTRTGISYSDNKITLYNGACIEIHGMDKPERVEGAPVDGLVLDEFGNCKKTAWTEHIRPALSTVNREGWADLIGVPEGRNHYYDLSQEALRDDTGEWAGHTWFSSLVIAPKEVAAAKNDLDELTYKQEYEGSFVSFQGMAYHAFSREKHAADDLRKHYKNTKEIQICFDFNVAPGIAVICQDMPYRGSNDAVAMNIGAAIGEVWIPRNSNTEIVCNKILQDWGDHKGTVSVFGDSTGGSRGTAKTQGSDWEIIRDILGRHFGQRISYRIPKANPSVRARLNAVNSQLKSTTGVIRYLVDRKCEHLVKDLEGVTLVEGGSGEIEKPANSELTHISDAFGYMMNVRFPIDKKRKVSFQQL
ncbi:MAG TPA: hypothetical protein ENG14_02380 [Thermodesulforhabdus norvegica]|uniref:Terminase-like family protein n=1 Tax=Thermodesulforhabdus norvegica TaxID=39841 RepID=A0A7C0WSR3_9BACT|nr:hypothetical protein [Thermodesulforhabdus norvegica]